MTSLESKLKEIAGGSASATARAISAVEGLEPEAIYLLEAIAEHKFKSPLVIGVTGAPGVGKSTLIDKLIGEFRKSECMVGVVSVDPSSVFGGGAFLGDRYRMLRHSSDPGVFIRSMASRGCMDGLAYHIGSVVKILAFAGFGTIILETVGMGQLKCRIRDHASVTVGVCAPGFGDEIQSMKAGLLELADIVVMNKADLPNAAQTIEQLQSELHHRSLSLVETIATQGVGVRELKEQITGFRKESPSELNESGQESRNGALVELSCQLAARLLDEMVVSEDLNGDQLVSAARLVGRLSNHPLVRAASP